MRHQICDFTFQLNTHLTKRVHIEGADDDDDQLIGIASDERIWKLCFEVNNSLKINLIDRGLPPPLSPDSPPPEGTKLTSLFQPGRGGKNTRNLTYYEDTESFRGREFVLCSLEARQLPKEAKAFRYFLLIRAVEVPPPETETLLQQLNELPSVRSAVDITHFKNIKSLIH